MTYHISIFHMYALIYDICFLFLTDFTPWQSLAPFMSLQMTQFCPFLWLNNIPKDMTNLNSILKSREITDKGPCSQSYGFSSSHVWTWELDYKESWVQKNWCFWTVALEKTLESPLDCKEIQPVHPKGNQSWIFIGRTDAGAETPIL